jgi:hypothetical protein
LFKIWYYNKEQATLSALRDKIGISVLKVIIFLKSKDGKMIPLG